jgi:translation elongation factor EF-G
VKDVRQSKVGDTVTSATRPGGTPLACYREPPPMVFSGLYPVDGSQYPDLREALDKLKLNDAALAYEPETSAALGFGFRCGFLGLLHMEIVRERLEREFNLDLISTAPNVVYSVLMEDGTEITVTNPRVPTGKVAGSASRWCGRRSSRRASTSARSWSCASSGAARSVGWTTCPPSGSRSGTRCRSPRSSSTSSTS